MLSKARIKLIVQLRQKKQRDLHKMFLAEGTINVVDFIKSGTTVIELFAKESWIQNNMQHLANINTTIVTEKEQKKITALSTPSEVLTIFELPNTNYINNLESNKLCIALDNVGDPGNLGTIIRTADWFGIKHIYCSNNTVNAYNPKVVQATMGSLARVKVIYTNLKKLFSSKPKELHIFGAVLNGEPITKIKQQTSGIILIGSEAHGISEELLSHITHKITIPSYSQDTSNKPESLNASIANAIICYALSTQQ